MRYVLALLLGLMLACGAPAALAAAPTASTGVPTLNYGDPCKVNSNSATANGTVDPAGEATSYHFDYGPTAAYGARTAEQTVAGAGPVSATIPKLGYGDFHYRLVATNPSGVALGADVAFTLTMPAVPPGACDAPPIVRTGGPVAVAPTPACGAGAAAVMLTGDVAAPPRPATVPGPLTAYFAYGPTAAYGQRTAAQPVNLGASREVALTAALPGTDMAYHYMLVVSGPLGVTGGSDSTYTPGPGACTAAGKACTVPRLRGLRLPAARRALKSAGCALGRVRKPRHRKAGKPVVVAQSLAFRIRYPKGTKVAITLGHRAPGKPGPAPGPPAKLKP